MTVIGEAFVRVRPDMSVFGPEVATSSVASAAAGGSSFGSKFMTAAKVAMIPLALGAGALLTTTIGAGFGRLVNIENATASLKGLGYQAKTVNTVMDNALKSVKGTAFGLDEAAQVASTSIASGVKPGQDLTRTLGLVADAATIGGTSMSEMGAIFNKVAASNKVQGDTIAQLSDRGIPIVQLLGEELGKTNTQVVALASQGKISFDDFRNAIESGMGGAALKSGNTTTGAFKNMLASLSRIGANLLSGVFPLFKKAFQGITDALAPVEKKATDIGKELGKLARGMIKDFGPQIASVMSKIPHVLDDILDALQNGGGSKGGSELGENLKSAFESLQELLPIVHNFISALPSFSNLIKVGSTVLGFLAKHADLLAKALPFLVAAFVAYKAAQAAANIAALARVPIMIAEVGATYQLAASNRALTESIVTNTAAQGEKTVATGVGTAATNAGFFAQTRVTLGVIRNTAALLVQKATQLAVATATKVWAAAQWLLDAAMDANPIGLVIVAVAALVVGIIELWKHSETFRTVVLATWAAIKTATVAVFNFILDFLKGIWDQIGGTIKAAWSLYKTIVTTYLRIVWTVIKTYAKAWWTTISTAFKAIVAAAKLYWKIVSTVIKTAITVIRTIIQAGVAFVMAAWARIQQIVGIAQSIFDRVVSIIQGAVSRAVDFVRGMPGKIIDIFNGIRGKMLDVAGDIIGGLVQGIKDGAGDVLNAIQTWITDKIPDWMKKFLGAESPAKVIIPIGRDVVNGLIVGVQRSSDKLKTAIGDLVGKIKDNLSKALDDLRNQIKNDDLFDQMRDRLVGQTDDLLDGLKAQSRELLDLADQRDDVADRLQAANAKMADLSSSVRDALSVDITAGEGFQDVTGLTRTLEQQLRQTRAFSDDLKRLGNRGLNDAFLQQIANQGLDAAPLARELAGASDRELRRINDLQGKIAKSSGSTGRRVGHDIYGGVIAGLRDRRKDVEKEMSKLARAMVHAVKRALKISSPSRVFDDLGAATVEGLRRGIGSNSRSVVDELARLSGDMAKVKIHSPHIDDTDDLIRRRRRGRGGDDGRGGDVTYGPFVFPNARNVPTERQLIDGLRIHELRRSAGSRGGVR